MFKRLAFASLCGIGCVIVLTGAAQAQPASMQQLMAERQRLQNIWGACQQQNAVWGQQAPLYAAQGQVLPPPACMANVQELIRVMWLNDINIAHLNGDGRPGCQIEPMPGCEYWQEQ